MHSFLFGLHGKSILLLQLFPTTKLKCSHNIIGAYYLQISTSDRVPQPILTETRWHITIAMSYFPYLVNSFAMKDYLPCLSDF